MLNVNNISVCIDEMNYMLHKLNDSLRMLDHFFNYHGLLACMLFPNTTPEDSGLLKTVFDMDCKYQAASEDTDQTANITLDNVAIIVCRTVPSNTVENEQIINAIEAYLESVSISLDYILGRWEDDFRRENKNLTAMEELSKYGAEGTYKTHITKLPINILSYGIYYRTRIVIYDADEMHRDMREFIQGVVEKTQQTRKTKDDIENARKGDGYYHPLETYTELYHGGTFEILPRFHYIVNDIMNTYYKHTTLLKED